MSYDVCIIGGGLAGIATAYYLARDGARACLLDKGDLNRGASGQNAGSLHFQMEHRLIEHGAAMTALTATIIPLSRDAIGRWQGIATELGEEDLDVVMHGGLMVAETAADVARLERKHEHEARWGLPTRMIDAAEVQRIAPYLSSSVLAASFCPVEGHGNPRLITAALARRACNLGLDISVGTQVTGLQRMAGRWHVDFVDRTGNHHCREADMVLNAAGAWAGQIGALAGLHIPVLPVALTMNATEPTTPFVNHLIQHAGKRLSLKQFREGNVLIGGGWSARLRRNGTHFDLDKRPFSDLDSITGNLGLALDLVPRLEQLHLLRSWTGIVGITADSLPILGAVPQAPGYFVATGGSGFTLGLTYGALMAQLMLSGTSDLDIAPFSPARFNHFNMFMEARQ